MHYLYEVSLDSTLRSYYGVAVDPQVRLKAHLSAVSTRSESGCLKYFVRDAVSVDDVHFQVLSEYENKDDALAAEKDMIERDGSCYNIQHGHLSPILNYCERDGYKFNISMHKPIGHKVLACRVALAEDVHVLVFSQDLRSLLQPSTYSNRDRIYTLIHKRRGKIDIEFIRGFSSRPNKYERQRVAKALALKLKIESGVTHEVFEDFNDAINFLRSLSTKPL